MRILALTYSALLFAGCAAPMSPRAAAIQVHDQMSSLLDKCKNLGPVTATETNKLWGWEAATPAARVKAREQAADMGADTLVLVNMDALSGVTVTLQGAALRCYGEGSAAPASHRSPPPTDQRT